ncbi:mannose/glucose-specific lectin-like protein [Tanacetum coccineum]|uniref:Mannose/glucose-specific lectin-like protein n=1 Tax=Tanacetum coccineum TaxID=301880 RepID=A0ABQ5CB81_9ASTR
MHPNKHCSLSSQDTFCNLDCVTQIILDVDEEVIGISGTVGTCIWDNKPILVISSLYFKTNKNNCGVYGQPKNVNSKFSKSWGVGLFAGFHGRSGTYLDAFGCYLKNKDRKLRPPMSYVVQEPEASLKLQIGHIVHTELWGSIKGGSPWSFLLENNQKLRKIIIDHKEWIYSVTFIAEDINGSFVTQQYGGSMGTSNHKLSEIILDVDEEVIGISGTVGTSIWDNKPILVISSLYFKTNKNNYGVYGQPKNVNSEFSKSWVVGSLAGFHGRSGAYLDAFGCSLKN